MKKTVRKYKKESRNNQARRCAEKFSCPGHQDSDFKAFEMKSKLGRQALFQDFKISISERKS